MAKSTAERVQALRQHRKAMGFVRLELFVLPEDVEPIKKYVAKRTKASIKASGKTMTDRIYGAMALPSPTTDGSTSNG
jgi:hypothetical protein